MVKSVLDAEAARVLHAHDPRVDVREADLRRVLHRLALDDALRAEVNESSPRSHVATAMDPVMNAGTTNDTRHAASEPRPTTLKKRMLNSEPLGAARQRGVGWRRC
jgi:hypothetical protein